MKTKKLALFALFLAMVATENSAGDLPEDSVQDVSLFSQMAILSGFMNAQSRSRTLSEADKINLLTEGNAFGGSDGGLMVGMTDTSRESLKVVPE